MPRTQHDFTISSTNASPTRFYLSTLPEELILFILHRLRNIQSRLGDADATDSVLARLLLARTNRQFCRMILYSREFEYLSARNIIRNWPKYIVSALFDRAERLCPSLFAPGCFTCNCCCRVLDKSRCHFDDSETRGHKRIGGPLRQWCYCLKCNLDDWTPLNLITVDGIAYKTCRKHPFMQINCVGIIVHTNSPNDHVLSSSCEMHRLWREQLMERRIITKGESTMAFTELKWRRRSVVLKLGFQRKRKERLLMMRSEGVSNDDAA